MEPRPEDKYPKTYQLRRTITENEKGSKIKIALEEKAKQAKVGGTWGIHDEKISSFEENFFTSLPKEYQELEPDIKIKKIY